MFFADSIEWSACHAWARGFDTDTHTYMQIDVFINCSENVKISPDSFAEIFLRVKAYLALGRFALPFPFCTVFTISWLTWKCLLCSASGFTRWKKMWAGDMTLSFPDMYALLHLHISQMMDPATSSPTALPCPPPSPGPQPLRHLKTRKDLGWKLKKRHQKHWQEKVSAALLSLSMASWAVEDTWVNFVGAEGGKSSEEPCLLFHGQGTRTAHHSPTGTGSFETGHHCDHQLPESTCRYGSHSASLPNTNNFA